MGYLTREDFMNLPDYDSVKDYCMVSPEADLVSDLFGTADPVPVESADFNDMVCAMIDTDLQTWEEIRDMLNDVDTEILGCEYACRNVDGTITGFSDDDLTELKEAVCDRIDSTGLAASFFAGEEESPDTDDIFDSDDLLYVSFFRG